MMMMMIIQSFMTQQKFHDNSQTDNSQTFNSLTIPGFWQPCSVENQLGGFSKCQSRPKRLTYLYVIYFSGSQPFLF